MCAGHVRRIGGLTTSIGVSSQTSKPRFGGVCVRSKNVVLQAMSRLGGAAPPDGERVPSRDGQREQQRGQDEQHGEQRGEHGFPHFSAMRTGWNSTNSRRIIASGRGQLFAVGVGVAFVMNVTEATAARLGPQPPNFRRCFGFRSQVP